MFTTLVVRTFTLPPATPARRRASSSDNDWKNGNGDARPIPPNGTLTLAELSGPGMITHIWFTIAHDAPFYSSLLTLRVYWDDEDSPSVESPIGDFFGLGLTELPPEFVQKWETYFASLDRIDWPTLGLSATCLAGLIVWPKVNRHIPAPPAARHSRFARLAGRRAAWRNGSAGTSPSERTRPGTS